MLFLPRLHLPKALNDGVTASSACKQIFMARGKGQFFPAEAGACMRLPAWMVMHGRRKTKEERLPCSVARFLWWRQHSAENFRLPVINWKCSLKRVGPMTVYSLLMS